MDQLGESSAMRTRIVVQRKQRRAVFRQHTPPGGNIGQDVVSAQAVLCACASQRVSNMAARDLSVPIGFHSVTTHC